MSSINFDTIQAIEPDKELILYWYQVLKLNKVPLGDLYKALGMLKYITECDEEKKKEYSTEFDRLLFILNKRFKINLYSTILD